MSITEVFSDGSISLVLENDGDGEIVITGSED